jgi:hypothetical protein
VDSSRPLEDRGCESRQLNGISAPPPSAEPTDRDRERARHRGVGTFVTIDGKIYIPMGGGYSASGMSVQAVTWADRLLDYARRWQRALTADAAAVLVEMNAKTGRSLAELHLALEFEQRTMSVVERQVPAKFSQYSLKF